MKKMIIMGRKKPKSNFKNIPIELQSKIFDRLCVKDQSRAMCVSHSWHERVLYKIITKRGPTKIVENLFPIPFLYLSLQQLLHCCSRVIGWSVKNLLNLMTHEKNFSCFVTAMMRLITSHEVFITTMS
jgi:hypothetical protein